MTADFLPGEEQLEGPSYPVAFGIEMTPRVLGIGIAVLGIAGSAYFFTQLVSPLQTTKTEAETRIADLQTQINQQQANLQQLDQAKASLDEAIAQRVEIYKLLGSSSSLDTLLLDINQQIKGSNASVENVIKNNFDQAQGSSYLAALGFSPQQIETFKTRIAKNPNIRVAYESKLYQFDPTASTLITEGEYGPALNNRLERQTVTVGIQALFEQTQSILRNIERLQPLITITNIKQAWAPAANGVSEEDLKGLFRPLNTTFTMEVLVPVGDPTEIPAPPPPPEAPADGSAPPPEGAPPPAP